MRGLVISILIVVIMASISFVVASVNSNNQQNEIKNEESKILEFSTFTSAVCENKEDIVHCKDEVFVNCNGEISKAVGNAECNGMKIDVPKATGAAVFEKEWKDPRN